MHSQTTYFRFSLLLSCILFLGIAPFTWIASLFVPGLWNQGIGISSIFVVALLNLAITTGCVFYYRVSINSRGIKCTTFWGKLHFVEWSTIRGARFYSGFLTSGLKFILISTTKVSQDLWLPLLLNDLSHFEQLVSKYAGTSNPLVKRLKERNTIAYLLKEAEAKIKFAWEAGIVYGTINLIFVFLSLAGYDLTGFGLMNASALLDVCLIFCLSFGIYKKSRVAAVIMLVYFLLSKAWIAIGLKIFPGVISWFFLILFLGGVQGTFTYRKLSKS
ncbi:MULTISPECIES: hypothetical protein [unclassified Microcoleus]|uniref:hypothetical protein n=1 Tax=unclassified Microcoleus TaxID=2642155 RepID=UPI002FD31FA7